VYLRARYYNPADGRFQSRDTWGGEVNRPLSLNRWMYVEGNPINALDHTGQFSESLITNSLHGISLSDAFGQERYGVARWGFYNFLKEANAFHRFTLLKADFGMEGPNYPLASDVDGNWAVYDSGCELVFVNNKYGFNNLSQFLDILNDKAEFSSNISDQWWRPSTLQYHWYLSQGRFYSDYNHTSDMPELLVIGGGLFLGGYGYLGEITDKFGNKYYTGGLGATLGVGVVERWEGYSRKHVPGGFEGKWGSSENELKNIILGWSLSDSISIIDTGTGMSINNSGLIALYGPPMAMLGVSGSLSYTWEAPDKDYLHRWQWVDEIRSFSPP
jgi:hypothetical protein